MRGGRARWANDNRFEPARRWQQDMIDDARWMIAVVTNDRHSVHSHDFKRCTIQLQIQIAIGGSVDETPELALARSDFNLRPQRAVDRIDFFCRLWCLGANIRTDFHALLQISGL